jgi:hypothetical protein
MQAKFRAYTAPAHTISYGATGDITYFLGCVVGFTSHRVPTQRRVHGLFSWIGLE